MGSGRARPIKFLDVESRRGPAHHIFEVSRPGPGPAHHILKTLGPARLGPAHHYSKMLGPAQTTGQLQAVNKTSTRLEKKKSAVYSQCP